MTTPEAAAHARAGDAPPVASSSAERDSAAEAARRRVLDSLEERVMELRTMPLGADFTVVLMARTPEGIVAAAHGTLPQIFGLMSELKADIQQRAERRQEGSS